LSAGAEKEIDPLLTGRFFGERHIGKNYAASVSCRTQHQLCNLLVQIVAGATC